MLKYGNYLLKGRLKSPCAIFCSALNVQVALAYLRTLSNNNNMVLFLRTQMKLYLILIMIVGINYCRLGSPDDHDACLSAWNPIIHISILLTLGKPIDMTCLQNETQWGPKVSWTNFHPKQKFGAKIVFLQLSPLLWHSYKILLMA